MNYLYLILLKLLRPSRGPGELGIIRDSVYVYHLSDAVGVWGGFELHRFCSQKLVEERPRDDGAPEVCAIHSIGPP